MFKKKIHLIIIFIFTIIICGYEFFTKNGTYFLIDGTFSPISYIFKDFFSNSLFWVFNNFFNYILGYEVFSKLFFFLIVYFSGFLGYIFSKRIIEIYKKIPDNYHLIAYIGVIFMMINPFFYERMITQPGIYLSILLLGYSFYFLLKTIENSKIINFLLFSLFAGLSITISQHVFFMLFIIVFFYFIFYVRNIKSFLNLFYSGLLILFLNLNWIIGGFFLGNSYTTNSIDSFNQSNIDNFLTNSLPGYGIHFTNLMLYGFWGERFNYFYLPTQTTPIFFIGGTIILLIIIIGIYFLFKNDKKLFLFIFPISIISFILGLGTNSKIFGFISEFLYNYIPFYIGLREPQKWIGVLMIIYLVFFINGLVGILSSLNKKVGIFTSRFSLISLIFIFFLILNTWSSNVIYGFKGQLFIEKFPKSYLEFKNDYKNYVGKSLVLPWHSYMGCDYTKGRIISNLSKDFFYPQNIVSSDNIEIGTLYSNSKSQESKDIENFLENKDYNLLKKHDFESIIFLDNCGDFKKYYFLENDNNIEKIYDSKNLKFYKIK